MSHTAVRLQAIHEIYGPQSFFGGLNKVLYDNLQRMDMDKNMTFLMMDYSEGKIRLSGQHEEVIVVRKHGEVEQIDTIDLGFILGGVPDISDFIEYFEIQLEPGDCLILYTDGIT
ncbi:MAG: SpoIIE family protein phosphatase [Pseudomonadota bacterium]